MASRWLKSVNNLLDSLDGQAENVATTETGLPTSRTALNQVLTRRGLLGGDDPEDDGDDGDDDDDEEYLDAEEGVEEEIEDLQRQQSVFADATTPEDGFMEVTQASMIESQTRPDEATPSEKGNQDEAKVPPKESENQGQPKEESKDAGSPVHEGRTEGFEEDTIATNALPESAATEEKQPVEQNMPPKTPEKAPQVPPPSPAVPLPTNADFSKLQQQLKKYKVEFKKSQTEARQLRKHVMQLNSELESVEAEVSAQRDELKRAGERLEKERNRANEEREDLLDDHDEEIETQKEQYENMLQDQKEQYEEQLADLQDRLARSEKQRAQEDGDWTKELEEALERERDALKKLGQVREEKAALKSSLARVEAQQAALQTKLESSSQSIQTATERERQLEDKLDATLSMHSRQLSKRQAREAELERTIADLGAALAAARQKEKSSSSPKPSEKDKVTGGINFKEQFENVVDELETVRLQLTLETERSEALRQELNEVSQERTQEASEAQAKQRQNDRDIADLRTTVAKLEGSLREKSTSRDISFEGGSSELIQSRKQVESLSEQLIRHQSMVENYKTEILALKNRLKSANARAESAETALATASSTQNTYEIEGGVGMAYGASTMRKRFKGGRSKAGSSSTRVRSIRSALDMRPGRVGEGMEQVAETVDAIDSWMVETGGFLRQEPLARLAFFMYIVILHFWSFCLVIFHTSSYEEVHGDFGSMSDPLVPVNTGGGPPPGTEHLLRHSLQP